MNELFYDINYPREFACSDIFFEKFTIKIQNCRPLLYIFNP
jgi:hypothetical protein